MVINEGGTGVRPYTNGVLNSVHSHPNLNAESVLQNQSFYQQASTYPNNNNSWQDASESLNKVISFQNGSTTNMHNHPNPSSQMLQSQMPPTLQQQSFGFAFGGSRQGGLGNTTFTKSILPPLFPNESPTFVNSKQVDRIIKMRRKRVEKMQKLGYSLQQMQYWQKNKFAVRPKILSRTKCAKNRPRLATGQFASKSHKNGSANHQ